MIYWDIILDCFEEDVATVLQALYDHSQSLHDMADFLGISVSALRRELKRCGVAVREKHDNVPKRRFEKSDRKLLNDYTTWILRRRGIKMSYKRYTKEASYATKTQRHPCVQKERREVETEGQGQERS